MRPSSQDGSGAWITRTGGGDRDSAARERLTAFRESFARAVELERERKDVLRQFVPSGLDLALDPVPRHVG